ncbi:sensor histidine kinase [uncultured Friedmanniella sp.]|uniref:sensor histidine kinase n=1 Tax=uncultured Friedmanniella sp. TaxID=335381 RepID=UPI0035CA4B15
MPALSPAVPGLPPSRVLPLVLGALTLGVTGLTVALDLVVTPADRTAADTELGLAVLPPGVAMAACGCVVLWHRRRHGVGLVLGIFGLCWVVDGLCEAWAAYSVADGTLPPGGALAHWTVERLGAGLLCGLPWLLLVFPDGHLMRGRARWYSVAVLAASASLVVALLVAPASVVYPADAAAPAAYQAFNPFGLPLSTTTATRLLVASQLVTFTAVAAAVAGVVVRSRGSAETDRRRLRWLLWAGAVCVVTALLTALLPGAAVSYAALVVAVVVTSLSATIGVLRPDLADIDALVATTLVWAGVAAVVLVVDAAVVALLTRGLGDRLTPSQLVAVVLGLAVLLYAPLRHVLSALVRRWLFGRRGDRYEVVSSLAARLEESADLDDQLPALAAAVAATFKLGFVRVEVRQPDGSTVAATSGTPPTATRELPIGYRGEQIGRFMLPVGGVRSLLSSRDQALLVDVGRQAAIALRSARLSAELQVSRERLVLAREEDRRRIRRDLHDGLGPTLGGVALRLDAAGNAVRTDPDRTEQLVAQARAEVREALADVRRLVHDLRPPALDDLGLRGALQQQLDRARAAPLEVSLEMEPLPALPAAVEVAAYRIASEAVTNVVRHAGARRATVGIGVRDAGLELRVVDDGTGIEAEVGAGTGLRSIRERVAELGGRCQVSCPPAGGTTVTAWLPLDPRREPVR